MADEGGRLAAQRDLQVRRTREAWSPIAWVFLGGLIASAIGVAAMLLDWRHGEPSVTGLVVYSFLTLLFAWPVWQWRTYPRFAKSRIVPCFAQPLGEPRGPGAAAFWERGHALFVNAARLDELASRLGVPGLGDFGFADDLYGQAVDWHPSQVGAGSVEALRAALTQEDRDTHLARDLEALDSVLRLAASRGVEFRLVLRVHHGESLQGVQSREARQGSFW